MNASAGPDAIVYEQAGYIHLFDVKSGQSKQLTIDVVGDFPWARAQIQARRSDDPRARRCRRPAFAPRSRRAARSSPCRWTRATVRNLTQTPGAHDRDPVWSPDGAPARVVLRRRAANDELMIGDQSGLAEAARDRAARPRVLLRRARLVAERQDARRSTTTISTCGRSTSRRASATKIDTDALQRARPRLRRRVVAGLEVDRVLEEPRQPHARDIRVLDGRRQVAPGHRRDSPTPSRRRSTRAASISTSSRARTTARAPAGSR